MPTYDKYEPYAGGFRAPIDAAVALADRKKMYAVGLNSAGRVVIGAGQSGILGVLITHNAKAPGDVVDTMTAGEIVWDQADTLPFPAGTALYGVGSDGTVTATATGNTYLGHTVEASRFVVRVSH